MKFSYQISEKDYLDFQLYTASRSPGFYRRQRNGRYFLTLMSLVTAAYFSYVQDWGMFTYFGVSAVVFFVLYPIYFKWRQKVHYTKYIRRNHASLFGRSEELEIKGKNLQIKNATGEGQVKRNELEKFIETKNHFFIQLKSGASLIIPLHNLPQSDDLRRQFRNMKIPVVTDLGWKW